MNHIFQHAFRIFLASTLAGFYFVASVYCMRQAWFWAWEAFKLTTLHK